MNKILFLWLSLFIGNVEQRCLGTNSKVNLKLYNKKNNFGFFKVITHQPVSTTSSTINDLEAMRIKHPLIRPLVVIGVPAMGFSDYENIKRYSYYLRLCLGLTYKVDNKTFADKTPVIVSGSPLCNSTISKDNYKNNKDFKYYVQVNNIANVTDRDFENYKKMCFPNSLQPDLGQDNCQKCFEETVAKQIQELQDTHYRAIFHGNSQGTATILNYLAKLVKNGQYNKKNDTFRIGGKEITIKAIILEGTFATGTSAIYHTALWLQYLKYAPYFFWPSRLVSSLLLSNYNKLSDVAERLKILIHNAKSQQPIESIQKIPKKVSIVIAHSENDIQTPFSDAKALYYARKSVAHADNTYFIPIKGYTHIKMFRNIKGKAHCLNDGRYTYDNGWRFWTLFRDSYLNLTHNSTLKYVPHIYQVLYPLNLESKNIVRMYNDNFQPQDDFGKKEYDDLIKKEGVRIG